MTCHERQRQESMCDRGADWQFTFGALDIDMNELVIVGTVGEFVDAILIDGEPFGRRELFADPGSELLEGNGFAHGRLNFFKNLPAIVIQKPPMVYAGSLAGF